MSTLSSEILDELAELSVDEQREVLAYVRALSTGHAARVSGASLLRFAGAIAPEDLAEMARAIHEDCEQLDMNGW